MRSYSEYLAGKRQQYGNLFDSRDLAHQFVPYFESGERIEVRSPWGTRRGRVGVTTGWKPVFILLARRNARGSSDVLTSSDTVVRVVTP